MQAEIGLIGLGTMGANLALNIAENGYRIAVYNRTAARTDDFVASAGDLAGKLVPCKSLEDLVAAIKPPRPIILMVQAGEAVDAQIAELRGLMSENDIIIDAGNTNFRDTRRRTEALDGSGLTFIGMGVSGGAEGARHGPSIMVGGTPESYARIESVLTAIAAKYQGEPCCAHLGPDGAGNFVKTIHNGIEYGDMQLIAETYGFFRDGLHLSAGQIAPVFARWNQGRLESYLIEITAKTLAASDPVTGREMVDMILDRAGQKGTGRWSVIEAQNMGVPATVIEAAVAARSVSAMKSEREVAEALYGARSPALTADAALETDLEKALLAGKIVSYAQGFAVLRAASQEFSWDLPFPTIARIWREGCIIRSVFLNTISEALEATPDLPNLLLAPSFAAMMRDCVPSLRKVVALGATAGLPIPALSAALAYFDDYTRARGTANLVQAQRDFFGEHGFERIDSDTPGHHGPWVAS